MHILISEIDMTKFNQISSRVKLPVREISYHLYLHQSIEW